jgi:Flp pilus assembly protein TadG
MKSQKGAAAIEFYFVLPVLLFLLFGIIEFSVLFYDKAVITNASREGARAGIVRAELAEISEPLSEEDIQEVVDNYCAGRLITFGSSEVATAVTGAGGNSGDPLTVLVQYQYDFLVLPNFVTSLAGAINLTAQTVMRME